MKFEENELAQIREIVRQELVSSIPQPPPQPSAIANDPELFPKKLRKIVDLLWESFVWVDSPEGHAFWSNVCRKLEAIAAQGIKR